MQKGGISKDACGQISGPETVRREDCRWPAHDRVETSMHAQGGIESSPEAAYRTLFRGETEAKAA